MSDKIAKKLKLDYTRDNNNKIKYISANGGILKTIGYCYIDLEFGKTIIKSLCTIIDNLSADVLIGTDLLATHGMIIDYTKNLLKIGKNSINIFTTHKQTNYCLTAPSKIKIKAQTNHVEWIKLPDVFSGSALVETNNPMEHVSLREGIFEIFDKKIPIILSNNNKFDVVVGKNKYIADLEIIDKDTINSVEEDIDEAKNCYAGQDVKPFTLEKRNLSDAQYNKLNRLIKKFNQIFSKNKNDLGFYDKSEFEIKTETETPIKMRPYRVPYKEKEEVEAMIDEMLKFNIISKSKSPWSSPIVIIKKKDGSKRFCVDYRKLNKITIKDNFPVPLIEETLDSLHGSCFFTTLDLASGYWQMKMSKDAKEKSAFSSFKGTFEFNRVSFGLSNAVAHFQRTMESILEGLPNVKVYIDDIMIHSKSFDDHILHLEKVFERLKEANLKIKTSKCTFATENTQFLGFDINKDGIKPNNDKIKAMKNYPRPTNQKLVKRFLGMASYYRKFIPNYSSITAPINMLLKKDTIFFWDEKCESSFVEIIYRLTNPPLLRFPNLNKKFILQTDASTVGLGAVLAQLDNNGNEIAIGYASRMLKPAERNYATTELECLAIVWATEQFRPYLFGGKFHIYSDHNPLVYLDNMKSKTSRVARWRLQLAEYDYEIVYKKGILNANADALSRIETINSISYEDHACIFDEVRKFQQEDKITNTLIKSMNKVKINKKFTLKEGILFQKRKNKSDRLVIPFVLKKMVFEICHNDMGGGHLGFKKTWPKIRDRFYWRFMYRDTKRWLRACVECAKKKTPKNITKIEMTPIENFDKPFDMLGVDILGPLTETINGNKYVLVFTDYLSRWPECFAIKRIDAKTVAKIFVNEIIARHSAPKVLLSDQGKQFLSELVKEVCNYMKIQKIQTTAYRPSTNGLTEKFNETLCQILSIYGKENQTNWDELIPTALFAYRVSVQETTLQTPFETLYKRQPRLPNELEKLFTNEFVKDYDKQWDTAKRRIKVVNDKRKLNFDKKFKRKNIEIGDSVRLYEPATKNGLKRKLRGNMYSGPYKVAGKLKNGNLKLYMPKNKIYITHPDRVKEAEIEFERKDYLQVEIKNRNKKVSFSKELCTYIQEEDNYINKDNIEIKENKTHKNINTMQGINIERIMIMDDNRHNSTTTARHNRRLFAAIQRMDAKKENEERKLHIEEEKIIATGKENIEITEKCVNGVKNKEEKAKRKEMKAEKLKLKAEIIIEKARKAEKKAAKARRRAQKTDRKVRKKENSRYGALDLEISCQQENLN